MQDFALDRQEMTPAAENTLSVLLTAWHTARLEAFDDRRNQSLRALRTEASTLPSHHLDRALKSDWPLLWGTASISRPLSMALQRYESNWFEALCRLLDTNFNVRSPTQSTTSAFKTSQKLQ